MGRTSWPALLLLLGAGAAFAALGLRAWRLEAGDALRRTEERGARAARLAAQRAPEVAADGRGPAAEAWVLGLPLRRIAPTPEEALLLREAAWQEHVAGDAAAALAALERLAVAGPDVAAVAALRGAVLLLRLDRAPEARTRLGVAASAPDDLADDEDVPVRLAALYHAARGSLPGGPSAEVARFVEAAEGGRRLGGPPGRGPDDLLLALEAHAAGVGDVPAPLADAAARVRRGRALLAALPAPGVAGVGPEVVRRTGEALEARAPASLLEGSPVDDRVALRVVGDGAGVVPGPLVVPLGPPLQGLWVVADVDALGSSSPVPWHLLAGFAVYVLGSALAVVAMRRAVRAARLQGDFVAAVSHEMKTPIASVRAMAEMLANGAASDPDLARRYAERIGWEMERLGASVRNVLDAARIERIGAVPVSLRPDDPARVLREAVEACRPGLERRGLAIRVEAADAPARLSLDAEALRGVVANLLDNAAKYGGDRKEIEVRGGPAGGGYRIAVMDRGIGVPQAERERVFDRFWRGAAARAAALPGVGLGLHVARQVVEGHGGRIRAEAREGGGTTFVVDLPGRDPA